MMRKLSGLIHIFSKYKLKGQKSRFIVLCATFSLIGVVMIGVSRAATTTATIEPEQDAIVGNATAVSSIGASNGKAVVFGSTTTAANPLSSLPLMPWYGGPDYYKQFSVTSASAWTSTTFFPIGAWYMRANTQSDINVYKSLGINTSVMMESNNNLTLLRSNGLYAFPGSSTGVGTETVGYTITDEADMNYGPGYDAWSGTEGWNTCIPIQDNGGKCGYTFMSQMLAGLPANDGRFMYANYGKGIFPWWESDEEFAHFVNSYTTVISDDIYWYTDNDVCTAAQGPTLIEGSGPVSIYTGLRDLTQAECRRADNYGVIMDRMLQLDALDGKRQPVYAFVEVGAPFGNGLTITGPQVEGAVMNSLIHGASGIIYFKHNFGGSCQSNDTFIDCPSAPNANVTKINGYIKDQAAVLNSPSYQYSFGTGLDTMLKWSNGSAYVFAMADKGALGSKSFTLPPGLSSATSIQVLYENRTLPVSSGTFSDNFSAEYSYHIYKITL